MKLIFGTKKDANAFKKMDAHGPVKLAEIENVVPVPCSVFSEDIVSDDYIVDLDETKKNPIYKHEDNWSIEIARYIPKPKTHGVAVC